MEVNICVCDTLDQQLPEFDNLKSLGELTRVSFSESSSAIESVTLSFRLAPGFSSLEARCVEVVAEVTRENDIQTAYTKGYNGSCVSYLPWSYVAYGKYLGKFNIVVMKTILSARRELLEQRRDRLTHLARFLPYFNEVLSECSESLEHIRIKLAE